jgi:hypothetical protein
MNALYSNAIQNHQNKYAASSQLPAASQGSLIAGSRNNDEQNRESSRPGLI